MNILRHTVFLGEITIVALILALGIYILGRLISQKIAKKPSTRALGNTWTYLKFANTQKVEELFVEHMYAKHRIRFYEISLDFFVQNLYQQGCMKMTPELQRKLALVLNKSLVLQPPENHECFVHFDNPSLLVMHRNREREREVAYLSVETGIKLHLEQLLDQILERMQQGYGGLKYLIGDSR